MSLNDKLGTSSPIFAGASANAKRGARAQVHVNASVRRVRVMRMLPREGTETVRGARFRPEEPGSTRVWSRRLVATRKIPGRGGRSFTLQKRYRSGIKA